MGAPKQKWTPEEETALKNGVIKYGTGKWRTILSDPDFSFILKSRSNVDLKDKWRNINVIATYGSRKKAKLAQKRTPSSSATAVTIASLPNVDNGGQQVVALPPVPPVASFEPPRAIPVPLSSVDKIIMETITNIKKPYDPDGKAILLYIEENFKLQPDMKQLVTSRLKYLTDLGILIKHKHKYRVSPDFVAEGSGQRSPQLLLEGNKENTQNPEENGVENLTSQVDGEVITQDMAVEEAAAVVARAVAEADVATAEAEEAGIKAAEAQDLAEAAYCVEKAAKEALQYRMMAYLNSMVKQTTSNFNLFNL